MAFYGPKNEILTPDEFVDVYTSAYLIGVPKILSIRYTQSLRYIEDEIERILKTGIRTRSDIARVLAWKIGKIKHKDSEEMHTFIYADDWKNCETENPKRFGRTFDIDRFSEFILANISELERLAQHDPQECLNILRDNCISGIGTVYLITLLFFLSYGGYPIYDRFAMKALIGYEADINPYESVDVKIKVSDLPSKYDKGFKSIVQNEYGEYIEKLKVLRNSHQIKLATICF